MQPRVDRQQLTFLLLAWLGGATVCFAQDVARMDQVVQSYVSNGTGVYRVAVGQTMTIRVEGGQLAAQRGGGTTLPLLAESETRFFNRDINVVVEFVRDGAGNVAELVVLQGTHQERATRAK